MEYSPQDSKESGEGDERASDAISIEGDHLKIGESNHVVKDDYTELEYNNCELESDFLESEGNGNEEDFDQRGDFEFRDVESNGDKIRNITVLRDQDGEFHEMNYICPVVGMMFDSYEEAYNHYNCYAKDTGFAIRVKSSWTKRNSKEKRGAVLCCNCEGFKTMKEANSRRKETRTGCLAMIRLRLVDSCRWKVDEVKLEHNHSFDYQRANNSKSHKKTDDGNKRKADTAVDAKVKTIKLYRTAIMDHHGCRISNEIESNPRPDMSKFLKLRKGDIQEICDYFSGAQLRSPNFFYLMDLNDDGLLRNVFWVDCRSKASYRYFGDVLILDSTCLSGKYNVPLLSFTGVNHHGQLILFGSGFLADDSLETYIWLFRAFLTCMSGCPPRTVIADRCKAMQDAITEVFPRANLRINVLSIIQAIIVIVRGEVIDFESFQMALNNVVYDNMKVDDFERSWDAMLEQFGIAENESLKRIYKIREQWAPVYSKDTLLAGMTVSQEIGFVNSCFNGSLPEHTSLKEFLCLYDMMLRKMRINEDFEDVESRRCSPALRTSNYYELQLAKVLTNAIFRKFQEEVVRMSSCFSITCLHVNGSIATYAIKEQEEPGSVGRVKNIEVTYDKITTEIRCICNGFNFKGYLCRHSLCILNYLGVEEVPNQYILARWRKDVNRVYVHDFGSSAIDIANPVQWFDHLHRRAMQIVEEGMTSGEHYLVGCQAFKDSLSKIRLVADKLASQV